MLAPRGKPEIILQSDGLNETMIRFWTLLSKVRNSQLPLPPFPSASHSFGYHFNQWAYKVAAGVEGARTLTPDPLQYIVWARPNIITAVLPAASGAIVEVSPFSQDIHRDVSASEKLGAVNVFLAEFKPIWQQVISRSVVDRWVGEMAPFMSAHHLIEAETG